MADNTSGYYGVHPPQKNQRFKQRSKPYQARLSRGGQRVNLGYFATAEEAALCVARSEEGQAAGVRHTLAWLREKRRGCATPSPGNYIGLSAAAYIGRWS